jgi:hypothetical protein
MTKKPILSSKEGLLVGANPQGLTLRNVGIAIIMSLIAFAFWPVVWTICWYLFLYLPRPDRGDYFAPTEFEKLDGYRYVLGWMFAISCVVGVLVFFWKLAIMGAPADNSSESHTG